jgi:hypothetical protein
MLLMVLGFRLDPRQNSMFHPSCAVVKMMQRTHATPLEAWTGPEGSRRLWLPDILNSRNVKVARLSAIRTGRLYHPRKYSWYSFLLEAESTPGTQCGQKDYVNKNFKETTGNRIRDLQASSAVSQPTAPQRAGRSSENYSRVW